MICSNLLVKILYQCHWRNSSVAVISFRHCILVYLLFISHAKWCNVHRSRHSKHSTAPYRTVTETISREFKKLQINYSSKVSVDGYFSLTSDIFLKTVLQQCWEIRRPNHRAKQWKIWSFLYDFNNLGWAAKTRDGGADCFIL